MFTINHPDSTNAAVRPTSVRHWVILATTLMSVLLYLDRNCVAMLVNSIRAELELTQSDMSWFVGVFYLSYALGQVPSGWLSDRFGGRLMLVIYIAIWSLFTGLVGVVNSLFLLLVMRLGVGIGQAGAFPTAGGLISRWIPLQSRATASGLVSFGGRAGGAVAFVLTAWLTIAFTPASAPSEFRRTDLVNASKLCTQLSMPSASPAGVYLNSQLSIDTQAIARHHAQRFEQLDAQIKRAERQLLTATAADVTRLKQEVHSLKKQRDELKLSPEDRENMLTDFNDLLDRTDLYSPEFLPSEQLPSEGQRLWRKRAAHTESLREIQRLNRLFIETALPGSFAEIYGRGWRLTMLVYGAAGILVMGLFWIIVRDRPEQHPGCNAEELKVIRQGRELDSSPARPSPFPLMAILRSPSMWLNGVMQFGTNIGWVFLVTMLPRYLEEMHNVPFAARGDMATVVIIVGLIGMLSGGWITDRLTRRIGLRWGRGLPLVITRFTAAAAYVACIFLAQAGSSPWVLIAALSLVAFSTDLGNPAVWAFCQDVGGQHVGSVLGWGNMIGNLAAWLGPIVYVQVMGEVPLAADWNRVFWLCAGAFVVSGLCALGIDSTRPIVVESAEAA